MYIDCATRASSAADVGTKSLLSNQINLIQKEPKNFAWKTSINESGHLGYWAPFFCGV